MGRALPYTVLHRTVEPMSETWPAPELLERDGDLGWLAMSAPEDVIHIGVVGATVEEARDHYEVRRRFWAMLADA